MPERLRADRAHIWFSAEAPLEIDLVAHEEALRSALAMEPGGPRDAALSMALAEDGVLLEDEPYADWALRPARPSNWSAKEPGWSWPETAPGAGGARRPRLLLRLGKPAWRMTPRPKRPPPR